MQGKTGTLSQMHQFMFIFQLLYLLGLRQILKKCHSQRSTTSLCWYMCQVLSQTVNICYLNYSSQEVCEASIIAPILQMGKERLEEVTVSKQEGLLTPLVLPHHLCFGEDSLEQEMTTHSSILAWKIPQTEKPGGLQYMEQQIVGHD